MPDGAVPAEPCVVPPDAEPARPVASLTPTERAQLVPAPAVLLPRS